MKNLWIFFFFLPVVLGTQAQRVSLSPQEFEEALQEYKELGQPFVLLDVRTPSEYKSGHLEGAILLNWQEPDFKERFKEMNIAKDVPLLVYCYRGGRSAEAANYLKEQGYIQVMDMKGGIYEWQKAGLPVTRK